MRTFFNGPATMVVMVALSFSTPSSAYTPQWLECAGEQVITTDGATTREPVTDVYVYDPDNQNLFRYSDTQKRLSLMAATLTSNQIFVWSGAGSINWEGRLDLSTMALRINYHSGSETRVWTQTCKPTKSRPETWQAPTG